MGDGIVYHSENFFIHEKIEHSLIDSFTILESNENVYRFYLKYPKTAEKIELEHFDGNIDKYLDIYRKIKVDKGNHFIKFVYKPYSFYLGLKISLFSAIIWLILLIKYKTKTIDEK